MQPNTLYLAAPEENLDSVMGQALRKAGVVLPGEKLFNLALDACRTHAKRNAQRKHVTDQLRGELTFALIERWNQQALGEALGVLLDQAQAHIDSENEKSSDRPRAAAAAAAPAVRRTLDDIPEQEPIKLTMPTPITTWDRDGRFANDESKASKALGALERTAKRLSKLDDFYINASKLGDVTPDEADSWAASRETDARFVRMLTHGMPRGTGQRIRDFVSDEDADKAYADAVRARVRH